MTILRYFLVFTWSLLTALIVLISGDSADASSCCENKGQGSKEKVEFSPGAEVTILLRAIMPEEYELAGEPSLLITLNEEKLKKLGLSASELEYIFNDKELIWDVPKDFQDNEALPEDYIEKIRKENHFLNGEGWEPAKIEFTISEEVPEPQIELPINLTIFFCSKEEGYCTRRDITRSISLQVGKSPASRKSGIVLIEIEPSSEELKFEEG